MTPELSVVIVSWNTRQLLRDCLHSLYNGGLNGVDAEVWVVDNASADGSAEMVREDFPQVRLIQTGENLGFVRANNCALEQATGQHYLLLNSDTVVPTRAIRPLLEALDHHPGAAIVGPMLRNADGTLQPSWARFPGWQSEISGRLDRTQSPHSIEALEARTATEPFVTDWVGGACFLVHGEWARRYGFFDERFFMYNEETEWCHRLQKHGGKTLYIPSVAITHLGGASSQAVPVATRRRLWQSALLFYRHVYGPLAALPAMTVSTARYLLSPLRRKAS